MEIKGHAAIVTGGASGLGAATARALAAAGAKVALFDVNDKAASEVAADNALGRTDAGAIDQDARRSMSGGGFLDCRFAGGRIRDVASNCNAFDVDGDFRRGLFIDVEDRDLGAGAGQCARGGGAEARRTAGDDRRLSLDFHQVVPLAAMTSDDTGVA